MIMERISVKSANIKSVGYDNEAKALEIEYKNGGLYQYLDVPAKTVAELHAAESMGSYLHKTIKPNHVCKKVGEVKKDDD